MLFRLTICLSWLAFGWVGIAAEPGGETSDAGYQIRLEVAGGLSEVIARADDLVVRDGDVRDVLFLGAGDPVRFRKGPRGITLPGQKVEPRVVLLTARGALHVAGRQLIGEVQILWREDGLRLINRLPLERYIEGVIASEMSEGWPLEALKAQAVAARSYAMRRCLEREDKEVDLASTTLDQVYKGIQRQGANTQSAVRETTGEVLTYGNFPIEALYHSCCGGIIRSAEEVFGGKVSYLTSGKDEACQGCPERSWSRELARDRLDKLLGKRLVGSLRSVRPLTQTGRRKWEMTGTKGKLVLSGEELRILVGSQILLSNDFTVQLRADKLVFQGRGLGHGVGLCQWGARGMAEKSADYRAILEKYYPGSELRKLY